MNGLDGLRGHGRMTWIDAEQGWVAALDEVADARSSDGFEECKREVTTSRRDNRPARGVWQGINKRTGAVASAIWVKPLLGPQALMFLTMDGESLRDDTSNSESDSHHENGGEASFTPWRATSSR